MKLSLITATLALSACATATIPGATDITAYDTEQMACVEHSTSRLEADTCRASSRARFCMRFPTMSNCLDGGSK
jgi:hypothetical protein